MKLVLFSLKRNLLQIYYYFSLRLFFVLYLILYYPFIFYFIFFHLRFAKQNCIKIQIAKWKTANNLMEGWFKRKQKKRCREGNYGSGSYLYKRAINLNLVRHYSDGQCFPLFPIGSWSTRSSCTASELNNGLGFFFFCLYLFIFKHFYYPSSLPEI